MRRAPLLVALALAACRHPAPPPAVPIIAGVAPIDAGVAEAEAEADPEAEDELDGTLEEPECYDLGDADGTFVSDAGEHVTLTACVAERRVHPDDVDEVTWDAALVVVDPDGASLRVPLDGWKDDYWRTTTWALDGVLRGPASDALVLHAQWSDEGYAGEELLVVEITHGFVTELWKRDASAIVVRRPDDATLDVEVEPFDPAAGYPDDDSTSSEPVRLTYDGRDVVEEDVPAPEAPTPKRRR